MDKDIKIMIWAISALVDSLTENFEETGLTERELMKLAILTHQLYDGTTTEEQLEEAKFLVKQLYNEILKNLDKKGD